MIFYFDGDIILDAGGNVRNNQKRKNHMNCFTVDLYDYFGVKKPENCGCKLTCYIKAVSREVDANRKSPAMLVIPGGGYGFCSFREAEPVALSYVNYGFNAFVLDYSVSPCRFPYPLLEAVLAMNYLRKNADELRIDANMIAAVGFSAGGHLCGMLGSYYDSPEVKKIFKSDVSARPNAVILSYPVIIYRGKAHKGSFDNLCGTDEELKDRLQIDKLVNSASSPAFIWATYTDGAVPVKNSLAVADAYEEAGVPFAIHVWGKGVHGISLDNMNVYGQGGKNMITEASKSLPKWVKLSVEWLEEQGVYVK